MGLVEDYRRGSSVSRYMSGHSLTPWHWESAAPTVARKGVIPGCWRPEAPLAWGKPRLAVIDSSEAMKLLFYAQASSSLGTCST